MTPPINLVPNPIQLRCAFGASFAMRMHAQRPDGSAFDLSPYTITAPFIVDGGGPVPAVAGWLVAVDLATSSVHLSLAEDDTLALAPGGKSATWHWAVWLDSGVAPERILFAHGDLGLLQP